MTQNRAEIDSLKSAVDEEKNIAESACYSAEKAKDAR
jgi:hypothetical protein